MTEGKLIIEVYEYSQNSPSPVFEYVPCVLEECLKNNNASLREIIRRGFDTLPKNERDSSKRDEVLQKLGEANIDRINVSYKTIPGSNEPYVELTNVVQMSMMDADARRTKNKNDIILYGKYRLSDGLDATRIKDAQRLSLIYSTLSDRNLTAEDSENEEENITQKEICLNITYLQD